MENVNAKVLALEPHRSMIVDRETVIRVAESCGDCDSRHIVETMHHGKLRH